MNRSVIESSYPIDFRIEDAKQLGEHLKHRHSVELIGMKRVGISNFLRFFLNHKDIVPTYIKNREKHAFISVDLNDLTERDLFPFWILTFKRLVDAAESYPLETKTKRVISTLFLDAIQSRDLFLTTEGLRKALSEIVSSGILPTIFFIRFDRIKDVVNNEFFANLQGLKDATGQKLSYVFTSFRALDEISPTVFPRSSLSVFSHRMYIKPAKSSDMKIIFDTFESKYNIRQHKSIENKAIELSGGHVQYLQLSLILLSEKLKNRKVNLSEIESLIALDERINLQSEEIWESITYDEQSILRKIHSRENVSEEEKVRGKYLWKTGIVQENGKEHIFSPLFEHYISNKEKTNIEKVVDLTKKEHMLFTILRDNLSEVCEREKIIESVWPEYQEFGVSDWTIDRLVARLRAKLKKQNNNYSVVTVKTRGYKLIEENTNSQS